MTGGRSSPAIVLLALGALIVASALAGRFGLASGLDRVIFDRSLQFNRDRHPQPVRNDPVLVGIDEAFLDSIGEPLALSHVYIGRFLDAMRSARPQVIGLDLALPEKRFEGLARVSDPGVDFHRVLLGALLGAAREIPVVTAKVWDGERSRFRDIHVDYAAALAMHEGPSEPLASAVFCSDPDGRVRRYPGRDCQPGGSPATLSSEIRAAAGVRHEWAGLIDFQLGPPFTYVPLQQVLALHAGGDAAGLQQLFKDRTVLLGTVLDDTDLLELPVVLAGWRPGSRRVPGVIAHAQALRTMEHGAFIQPASGWLALALPALFSLFWLGRALVTKLLLFGACAIALLWWSSQLLLGGTWLPPGLALITGLVAFWGRGGLEAWRNWSDKRRLTATFAGYVSPGVMREIVAGGPAADLRGRKLPVCVLFSDIRGFTTLSEHLPAEDVVALLNRYFARMTQVVHRHEGTVDKFIGDGLMAFFGAPNTLASPEASAFAAAREMLLSLESLNGEFAREGRPPVAIGIGLHSGDAVIGHIGSAERHEYTAIGDTVNTAARLEGLCKDLGYPVVCSQAVADALADAPDAGAALQALGPQALKGRSPMPVYGWRPDAAPAPMPQISPDP